MGFIGILIGIYLLFMGYNAWIWSTIVQDSCGPLENKPCLEGLNREIALYFTLGFVILIPSILYTFKKSKNKSKPN